MPRSLGVGSIPLAGRALFVVAAAFALATGVRAQPAVLTLGPELSRSDRSTAALVGDDGRSAVLAAYAVRFDPAALADAVALAAGAVSAEQAVSAERRGAAELAAELAVELAPGVAVRSRAVWAERRSGGGLTWSGTVEGDALGFVRLTAERNAVVGRVSTQGQAYEIRHSGGEQVVLEVDPEAGASCGAERISVAPSRPVRLPRSPDRSGAAFDTVRVMLLYGEDVAADLGEGRDAFIQSLVDTANDHLIRSEAPGRVALAAAYEVLEPETLSLSDQIFSMVVEDGYLDDVLQWRHEEGADVVTLMPYRGDQCGIAFIPSVEGSPDRAFNVARYSCARVLPNFAHELGHTLSLRHDMYVDNSTNPSREGHGYVDTEAPHPEPGPFRTVMAYTDACQAVGVDCPAVPYFSNADLTLSGRPLGEAEFANAVSALGRMIPIVADYHNNLSPTHAPEAPDLLVTGFEDEEVVLSRPPQGYGAGSVVFGTPVTQPRHGRLSGVGEGELVYRPNLHFFGADSFTYRVQNLHVPEVFWNTGIARVEVEPVPDSPLPSFILAPTGTVAVNPDTGSVHVRWSRLRHPDYPEGGAPLTTTWQLRDRQETVLEIHAGAVETIDVPAPLLDSLLADRGVGVESPIMLSHRVVLHDGSSPTIGVTKDLRLVRSLVQGPVAPGPPVLRAAYPNPTSDVLSLDLQTPAPSVARIELHDMLGREVQAIEQHLEAGINTVRLGLRALPAGVYLYRIHFVGQETMLRGRVTTL